MQNPLYIQTQNSFGISVPYCISQDILTSSFPLHRHDFIEIEFIVSGSGQEKINGISYPIGPGCLNMIMPWHSHEIIVDDKSRIELFKCSFQTELIIQENPIFNELGVMLFKKTELSPICQLKPEEQAIVHDLLKSLFNEYHNINLWKNMLICTKIFELIILFDRSRKSHILEQNQTSAESKYTIWQIVEYIHLKYNEDLTLKDLSDIFHYSESHINNLLIRNVGLNFHDILQESRVRNACSLLLTPNLTTSDIATMVGYHSRDALYNAFNKIKGMSPDNYRNFMLQKDVANDNNFTFTTLNSQIVYYLHMHYHEDISLESLAKTFHYNHSYLSSILQRSGFGFNDLLHEIRIYHACALLLTTDKSVCNIAYDVGYNSLETFYRLFKKLRMMTPSQYRNHYS